MIKELKKIIARSCVYFTAFEFALLVSAPYIMKVITKNTGEANFLTLKSAALIYLTFLLLSALDLIFKIPKVPSTAKRIVHFILCILSSLIPIVFVPAKASASIALISAIIFTFAYIIITLISYIATNIISNKKKDSEYESIL